MADAEEPIRPDPLPPEPCANRISAPPGIPLARPITVPLAREFHLAPTAPVLAREILLPDSSRLAALADVGALILTLFVLQTAAQLALTLLVGAGIPRLGETGPEMDIARQTVERALRIPGLVCAAFATFAAIGIILAFRRQSLRSVGVRRPGFVLDCVIGIGAVVALCIFSMVAAVAVSLLAPELMEKMSENSRRLVELIPNVGLLEFAGVAMVVGIYEEVLFRGFLMTRLRRITGSWTLAVLISTVVFTALHAFDQVWAALPMIAVLALVFSVVTIWRRSIIPAVVAHALFDFMQLLFLGLQMGDSWT